jgi:type II secretory pathway pseudopilin PulG
MDLVIWWLLALSIIGFLGGLGAIYFVRWSLWRNKQLTMLLVEHYEGRQTEEDIK